MLKEKMVPSTIICFDEFYGIIGWQQDEYRAFQEFIENAGNDYKYIACAYAGNIELTMAVAIDIIN